MDGMGLLVLICVLITVVFIGGIGIGLGDGEDKAMAKVHATLETRCVEGEQYSRDLLACVVTRQGR